MHPTALRTSTAILLAVSMGCGGSTALDGNTGSAGTDEGAAGDGIDGANGSADVVLGTVTSAGACALPTLLSRATCEQVTVACPGLESATLALIVAEPTGTVPLKGTILFGSGSAGASLMEQAAAGKNGDNPFVAELESLRAEGYRVIERAWQGKASGDRGWLRGTQGPDDSACRYATALTWLDQRFGTDGQLCAVGFSGGSMELAMAMERWRRASLLDYALFISGPLTSFANGCIGGSAWQPSCDSVQRQLPWQCGATHGEAELSCVLGDNITTLLDTAYGGATSCSSRSAEDRDLLGADSPFVPPMTDASYPTTGLGMLLGMRDCGSGAATMGADYAAHVTGKNGPLSDHVVPVSDAGHTVHSTALGAQKMAELLRAGCS